MALVGALALVTLPMTVSASAWADTTPDQDTSQISDSDWAQLADAAKAASALGTTESGSIMRLAAGSTDDARAKAEAAVPASTHTSVQLSQFTQDQLDQIQKSVMARDWTSDADRYGVTTSYDAETDKVAVSTDAPSSVTDPLNDDYPGDIEISQARLEPQSRFANAQPFWAGDALIATTGANRAGKCTAGFTIKDSTTGHLYLTTAGHCYDPLTHVYSRGQNDGFGNWVGQVTRRNQDIDTEVISGNTPKPFDSYMYAGGTPNSGSSMFIHGTQAPQNGFRVCVSGSVSFNHCGHPITNDHFSICWAGGNCIRDGQGFVYARGGTNSTHDNGLITQPGDSGAPIYTTDSSGAAAWIVGGHSGVVNQSDNVCRCSVPRMVGVSVYAILNKFNADVVTR
jgi:hypothetical protein